MCRASPSAHPVGARIMQRAFNKTTVLALLGTLLSVGALGAAPAPASTGGASAGGIAVPGPAAPPLHRLSHGASIATWFGPGFYGQRTACGQLLTPAVVGGVPNTPTLGLPPAAQQLTATGGASAG